MSGAYRDVPQGPALNAIEQAALLPLRAGYVPEAPIRLNEGTPYEEPFGPTLASEWAQRVAARVLT